MTTLSPMGWMQRLLLSLLTVTILGCNGAGIPGTGSSVGNSLGGSISGLTVAGLVLINGTETLSPAANATTFTFQTKLNQGVAYSVAIQTQPSGLTCSVANGSGTMGTSAVSNVTVTCTAVTRSLLVATLAGSGSLSYPAVDGPLSTATFAEPRHVAVDSAGNLYVTDANLIRKITPDGIVSTLAGNGQQGAANGPGSAATFNRLMGIAVDSAGNVYVADNGNNLIRKITPDGMVSTLAGTGEWGSANGLGSGATFEMPYGVAVDGAGNVYVADQGNNMIRKIAPDGMVSTLAGSGGGFGGVGSANGPGSTATFSDPSGIAVDGAGNVYVADMGNDMVRKITPDGIVSTLAGSGERGLVNGAGNKARFIGPIGVSVDSAGNVYVADSRNYVVRKITPAGRVSTLAGSGLVGSTDGPANMANFRTLAGIAVDGAGNVYVIDSRTIRTITPAGNVSTLAGEYVHYVDGAGSSATFSIAFGVVVDAANNVYVADTGNNVIRKITSDGMVSTLAGTGQTGLIDGPGNMSTFNAPFGIAADSAGNIYVADAGNNAIRRITPAGVVSTLAGTGQKGAGNGQGNAATFSNPSGVAVDSAGNMYVADTGNNLIRKITPAGAVSTFAGIGLAGSRDGLRMMATFDSPLGIAVDVAGNLYVADSGNEKVRKIATNGKVSTLAGTGAPLQSCPGSFCMLTPGEGPGNTVTFSRLTGVAVDTAGNVFVVGSRYSNFIDPVVHKITPDGMVSSLANTGYPNGIAVDAAGNLYVTDLARVLKLTWQ